MKQKETIKKVVRKLASKEKLKRLRNFLIAIFNEDTILKRLEKHLPLILKQSPKELPQILLEIKQNYKLDNDTLGNFIQKILIEKNKIHQKNPEFKPVIWNFSKENHIRGIKFHYI